MKKLEELAREMALVAALEGKSVSIRVTDTVHVEEKPEEVTERFMERALKMAQAAKGADSCKCGGACHAPDGGAPSFGAALGECAGICTGD